LCVPEARGKERGGKRVGGENHAPLCRKKGGVRVGDGSYLKLLKVFQSHDFDNMNQDQSHWKVIRYILHI